MVDKGDLARQRTIGRRFQRGERGEIDQRRGDARLGRGAGIAQRGDRQRLRGKADEFGLVDPAAIGGAAREAVRQALDAYREKPCRIGRARMFAERSVGKDDPGMLAFTRLAEALVPGAGR